ncbi:MAG: hypothetical protein ACYCZX_10525, partial [Rhodospirillaceae bacterium]
MKSIALTGLFLSALCTAVLAADPASAPHAAEGGVPQFERDMSWPQLPAAWNKGAAVSWAAVDDKDHVWLITR